MSERDAFVAGACAAWMGEKGKFWTLADAKAEALRRYPDTPPPGDGGLSPVAWLGAVDQGMGHWHFEIAKPNAPNSFPVYRHSTSALGRPALEIRYTTPEEEAAAIIAGTEQSRRPAQTQGVIPRGYCECGDWLTGEDTMCPGCRMDADDKGHEEPLTIGHKVGCLCSDCLSERDRMVDLDGRVEERR
jgi:hypothetical protein